MRIAIVNDVALAAEALRRVIVSIPRYELAWIARDGADAVNRCRADTPDLILMDLMMPGMDGVEATRQIMAQTPCAILVVTATIDGNSAKVFEALGAGALDAVQTPILAGKDPHQGTSALRFKIESIAKLVLGRDGQKTSPGSSVANQANSVPLSASLVAIGASAGGPAALAQILGDLPADFPGSVVIVQHIDVQFVPSLIEWLNEQSKITVRVARERESPKPNVALVAGTNQHLVLLDSHSIGYTSEPVDRYYRPSIDVFFESVAERWKGEAVGVLLTGMGRDGATGLRSIRRAGHLTIAQEASTCVVYGMPKAAIEINGASEILPINKIAQRLANAVSTSHR